MTLVVFCGYSALGDSTASVFMEFINALPDLSPHNAAQTALAVSPNAGRHSGNSPSATSISSRLPRHTRTEYAMTEGPQGTFEALSLMRSAVRGEAPPDYSGYKDPVIQQCAESILANAGARLGSIEGAIAIYEFVRDGIEYFDHEPNEQVVQDAKRTIELGTGDCVSQSVLLATLLAAADIQSRFVVQMPSLDTGYSHVYVEALVGDQAIALDPISDGIDGRPFGIAGWSQGLPDGGFESSYSIF